MFSANIYQEITPPVDQGGEVGTEHDSRCKGREPLDHVDQMRIQFRCPAGDVNDLEMAPLGKGHYLINGLCVHNLLPAGASLQMAVVARLVTEQPHVDL